MTKIEEILNYYIPPTCQVDSHLKMMKEYAEYYAKKCLEIAAENAETEVQWFYNRQDDEESHAVVNKESITNIQLPEHE